MGMDARCFRWRMYHAQWPAHRPRDAYFLRPPGVDVGEPHPVPAQARRNRPLRRQSISISVSTSTRARRSLTEAREETIPCPIPPIDRMACRQRKVPSHQARAPMTEFYILAAQNPDKGGKWSLVAGPYESVSEARASGNQGYATREYAARNRRLNGSRVRKSASCIAICSYLRPGADPGEGTPPHRRPRRRRPRAVPETRS